MLLNVIVCIPYYLRISSMHRFTFVPTSLPLGTGPVPSDAQVAFKKTMKVMAKVDLPSLSASKSVA
jgi:hypothetical protein